MGLVRGIRLYPLLKVKRGEEKVWGTLRRRLVYYGHRVSG